MPALTANSVTLEEVLEVRGGPLHEQEVWALLCFSSEALQDIFLEGEEFLVPAARLLILDKFAISKIISFELSGIATHCTLHEITKFCINIAFLELSTHLYWTSALCMHFALQASLNEIFHGVFARRTRYCTVLNRWYNDGMLFNVLHRQGEEEGPLDLHNHSRNFVSLS